MSQIAPSWITIDETCKLLNLKEKTVKDKCRNAIFAYKVVLHNRRSHYYIKFDSLPVKYQNRYLNIQNNNEWDSKKYSEAPNWAQAQADKYITIINQTEFLKGQQLVDFINEWNLAYPELATSYPSIIKMRRRYDTFGLSGLLSRKGQDSRTSVADVYYEYFKTLYLKEGSPSLRTCWELTLGYAIRVHRAKKENFPSLFAFKRRIEKEIPTQSIYMARKGETAWNRKYGCYIERDYSNVVCGKVWVSDHAQIDVACKTPDGKIVFPWVTAWRDYKSGKWLGWLLQCGHPNSDHIFQTFYYAEKIMGCLLT